MKQEIRKTILAKRKELPVEMIEKNSKLIIEKVIEHPQYRNANTIFAYIDAKGEVKTGKLIEDAWAKGMSVAVPKVHGDIMKFYLITSYEDLEPGCFGIQEPKEGCKEVAEMPDKSVVIMPGVAFDKQGNRIGYGKGYYDKYFSAYPDICKIAIAFELQLVSEIQSDKFDIKADIVMTEKLTIIN